MYNIAPYVQISTYKNKGIVGVGSRQIILPYHDWLPILKTLTIIKNKGFRDVKDFLKHYKFNGVEKALQTILQLNLLIPDNSFNSEDRYSRNSLYYFYNGVDAKAIQNKLNNKHVTLIGCGGIGSMIAYYLSTSGVKHLTLVDNDYIELSNLTRQFLFTESDIGKKKIDILKRELLKRNSTSQITLQYTEIKSKSDLKIIEQSDLYVVSADHPFSLINWINEHCVNIQQPYINIGYINDISVVGPFYIPQLTSCFECQQIIPNYESNNCEQLQCNKINSSFKPATFPSVNGVAASYAFADIIRFLGEYGEILSANKRIGIHSIKPCFEFQNIDKNVNCPICSKNHKK